MSARVRAGLIVALIHVLLVASLGGKLLFDRATRPRVWARTAPVDPDLPIRGRYVRMRIEGDARQLPSTFTGYVIPMVSDQTLTFVQGEEGKGLYARVDPARSVAVIDQPLAYFIPEHVPDPSIRAPGEELWVEVTLPRRGPPRPIRLGVKKDGVMIPQ